MTQLNDKWYKPEIYKPEDAIWANENGAKIEDKGDYYEVVSLPIPSIEEYNEQVRNSRASLYAQLIDPLHARKARKVILNDWSEADEAEYVAEVARISKEIEDENPYVVEHPSDESL